MNSRKQTPKYTDTLLCHDPVPPGTLCWCVLLYVHARDVGILLMPGLFLITLSTGTRPTSNA